MGKIYYKTAESFVINANTTHISEILDDIRQSDVDEIWSAYGMGTMDGMLFAFTNSSKCFTWVYNNKPIAMFGVKSPTLLGNKGNPWFIGTNEVNALFSTLYRHSPMFIDMMAEGFYLLENYVDCRNKLSIRWLKWCGFQFDEPKPYGFENKPFMRFWRYCKCAYQ